VLTHSTRADRGLPTRLRGHAEQAWHTQGPLSLSDAHTPLHRAGLALSTPRKQDPSKLVRNGEAIAGRRRTSRRKTVHAAGTHAQSAAAREGCDRATASPPSTLAVTDTTCWPGSVNTSARSCPGDIAAPTASKALRSRASLGAVTRICSPRHTIIGSTRERCVCEEGGECTVGVLPYPSFGRQPCAHTWGRDSDGQCDGHTAGQL
jgi:hypothetical protein